MRKAIKANMKIQQKRIRQRAKWKENRDNKLEKNSIIRKENDFQCQKSINRLLKEQVKRQKEGREGREEEGDKSNIRESK